MSGAPWRRRPLLAGAAAAVVLGAGAAAWYARLGLTLSHYDARGHLVVSRRIVDSITPGWQQVGAVWLPFPHLLNALPVQVDWFYRTGASGVAISIVSFAAAVTAILWLVTRLTGSRLAAVAGALVFALNPNVLYLQSTPMTEPLLMALTLGSIALLMAYCDAVVASTTASAPAWVTDGQAQAGRPRSLQSWGPPSGGPGATDEGPSTALVGWVFVLACMTRYEAWPVTIGALVASVWVLWRRGVAPRHAAWAVGRVAIYPLVSLVAFSIFSKVVVGAWFASGFFVPENPAQGQPFEAVKQIIWGLREISGTAVLAAAAAGGVVLTGTALMRADRSDHILPLALLGTASVPWSAFVDGHPYRIRYMVPLIAIQSICAGVAAGSWRRMRPLFMAVVVGACLWDLRPLNAGAPMVTEAEWDRPNIVARDRVTSCLTAHYRGESIMASMGSLGHYMQDLSRAGFSLRDILHEGNGDIWLNALNSPRPFAGWILIEEKAEGGDMLAQIVRERPSFLEGYTRTCEAAGVALYRRLE
ncbi:MAG: hypothetical protein U0Q55_03925 [Vicinamibacterales bacterium]